MKNVDLSGCASQYAIINIKTGGCISFHSFDIAEAVAEAEACVSPCVIIDMETMQIIDVFGDGGRLVIGAGGVLVRETEVSDVE
jgi:hypothetical protein